MKNIIETVFADYYFLKPKIKALPNLTEIKLEERNLSEVYKKTVNEFLLRDKDIHNVLKIGLDDYGIIESRILFDVKKKTGSGYIPQHISLAFSESEKEYEIIKIEYSNKITNLTLTIDDKDTLCITWDNDKNYLIFKINHFQDITFIAYGDKLKHFKEEYNTTEKAINFMEHLLLKPYSNEEKDLQRLYYDSIIDSIGFSDSMNTLSNIIEMNKKVIK